MTIRKRRATSCGSSRSQATQFCSRARAESCGAGPGEVSGGRSESRCFTGCCYEKLFQHFQPFRVFRYVTFRTALASLTALFLCIVLGPWLIASCAVPDRPAHPRRRAEVPSEESRHADHGRPADHHLHRGSDAAVGQPAQSRTCGSRCSALVGFGAIGFLDDYTKVTQQRNLGLTARRKFALQVVMAFAFARILLLACTPHGIYSTTINVPFFKQFKPDLLIDSAAAQSLDLSAGVRALLRSSWRWCWWARPTR